MRRTQLPALALILTASFTATPGCKKPKADDTPAREGPAPLVPEQVISTDYPPETFMTLTAVGPGPLVDAFVEQASPGYDWRGKLEGKYPGALAGFDLEAPVDMLGGYVPKSARGERFVVSFGVTSADQLTKSLSALGVPFSNDAGVVRISESDGTCELPAGAKRMQCWVGEKSSVEPYLVALDKRTHTGDPRVELTLDGAYLQGPLKADIDGGAAAAKVFGPQAFEQLRDPQLKEELGATLNDVVDGALAFLNDLERLEFTVGVQPGNAGMYARFRARLRSHDSQLAKWISPERLPSGPAPEFLFAMPADVDSAGYMRLAPKFSDAGTDAILARARVLAAGVSREVGLPEAPLQTMLDAMHINDRAEWSVNVQPRMPTNAMDEANMFVGGRQGSVVMVQPKGSHSAIDSLMAIEDYVRHPDIQPHVARLLDQAEREMQGMTPPKVESKALERIGSRAHKWVLTWDLGEAAQTLDLPKEMKVVVVVVEDDAHSWTGFGNDESLLLDYIRRAMAKQGPALGEDPRTSFLRKENAWIANYTPIDPTYVGVFAMELVKDMGDMMGELGANEPNAFAEFEQRMPALIEKWKQLPPSAARSRIVVDEQGLVWEGSTPSTTLRMMGDAIHMIAEVFREQKG